MPDLPDDVDLTAAITGGTTPEDKTPGIAYFFGVLADDLTGTNSDSGGVTLTTLCTVQWKDRLLWEQHMRGWAENALDGLHRVLPETCPFQPKLYCLSVDLVKSFGWDGETREVTKGIVVYETAVYRVSWGVPQYVLREDGEIAREYERYVMWRWSGKASYQQIPGGGLQFVTADKTPLDRVPIVAGRSVTLTATQLLIPYANTSYLDELLGKINSVDLVFDGRTLPAETVVFSAWEKTPKIDSRGKRVADYAFHFEVLSAQDGADGAPSWNKFLRKRSKPDGSEELVYALATVGGAPTGGKAFRSADLQDVFG